MFEEPLCDDEDDSESILSKASLDIRKYSWYPNKKIDNALSTYTVSPTPKKFDPIAMRGF
jgi:hypothetical protein